MIANQSENTSQAYIRRIFHTFLILLTYVFVSSFSLTGFYRLPRIYASEVLFVNMVDFLHLRLILGAALLLLIVNYVKFPRSALYQTITWDNVQRLPDGKSIQLRVPMTLLVGGFAWTMVAYDYNFYYDQAYYLDRLLLALLVILVYVNPIFVSLFTLQFVVLEHQSSAPGILYGGEIDKALPLAVLSVFSAWIFLRPFLKSPATTFLFSVLCITIAFYFVAGIAKLYLDDDPLAWLRHNELHALFVASYLNGWLAFLDRQTIIEIARVLGYFSRVLAFMTLIIELGGLFVLFNLRLTTAWLLVTIGLHIGIFLSSGIFFWKWILMDLIIFYWVWQYREDVRFLFSKKLYGVAGIVLVLLSPFYVRAPLLGWFDTRFTTTYDVEAVMEDGDRCVIPRLDFAPFEISFAQNRFWYLMPESYLVGTYGSTDRREIARLLEEAVSADDIAAVRLASGRNGYDPEQIEELKVFLTRYFDNRRDGFWLSFIHPPYHIHSMPRNGCDLENQTVERVEVRYHEFLYTEDEILTVTDRIVLEVPIAVEEGD